MKKQSSPPEKFFKVNEENGCWEWFANTCIKGYGKYKIYGKSYKAHRYMYEQKKGKIPVGHQIDHLCRNRKCVNPDHLEAVLPRDNQRRGLKTKLTEIQVIEIREKYKTGKYTQQMLAYEYKVSQTQISSIILYISWSDITGEKNAPAPA